MTNEEVSDAVRELVRSFRTAGVNGFSISDALLANTIEAGVETAGPEFVSRALFMVAAKIRGDLDKAEAIAALEKTLGVTEH